MNKLLIIALSVLFATACKSNTKEEEKEHHHGEENVVVLTEKQKEVLGLRLGKPVKRNLTTVIKVNGLLEVPPSAKAGVTALIGGNVKEIRVFHGDHVKKGQVLAVLEHQDYISLQEDFAVEAAGLEFLHQEYLRQKQLFENNAGSRRDYQKAKAEYTTSKVKYESLKSRLLLLNLSPEEVKNGNISNTVNIVSPVDGYVNSVNIKTGIYATPGFELFGITDNSRIHADFLVYEKDMAFVKKGQNVHFTVANGKKEYSAVIFAVGKEFDRTKKAVHIHCRISGNTDDLIPGSYVSGHIHTDSLSVLALPVEAVVKEGLRSFVFMVENRHDHTHDDDSLLELVKTEVVTGKTDAGYTEIKFLSQIPSDAVFATNSAYYLLSELKKEETEHEH
jgi:cobalt-zinc-cadmium efflux system membrane fusion protein